MLSTAMKSRLRQGRWMWALLVPIAIYAWALLYPATTVYYNDKGQEPLPYAWNVESQIRPGKLLPGDKAFATGLLFPNDEYFMEFFWHNASGQTNCVSIKPTRSQTHIHLDAQGNLDTSEGSGTDVDRLSACRRDRKRP